MYPFLFEVFGRHISSYGLFIVLGAVAAWGLVRLLAVSKDNDISLVFLICICGGFVGAFLLRPLMRIPEVVMHWERFRQMPFEVFLFFVFGEIVFYGGLIGGLIAMLLFCRGYNIPILPVADLFAPALALAHGVGRVGCFLGGCCYGVPVGPSHPFAVVFPSASMGAPPGVPLLATQLIEAACLFILAAFLVFVYKKTAGTGLAACLYGLLYSVSRFVLEFFRGDAARGVYGIFSVSQYISIVLFIVSAALVFVIIRRRWREKPI